jgi:DoxX-like family
MYLAYLIVTAATIAANAVAAIADFARAKQVLANAAELGIPESWIPRLGALKAAGAAGLLLGLLGARFGGVAAGIGLVLFFIGAIAAHVRAPRAYHNMAFPASFLVLAIASLILSLTR